MCMALKKYWINVIMCDLKHCLIIPKSSVLILFFGSTFFTKSLFALGPSLSCLKKFESLSVMVEDEVCEREALLEADLSSALCT